MAITKDKREKVRENYNGELPLLPFDPLSFFKLLQFSFSQEQEKIIDLCQVSLGLGRNLGKMESW